MPASPGEVQIVKQSFSAAKWYEACQAGLNPIQCNFKICCNHFFVFFAMILTITLYMQRCTNIPRDLKGLRVGWVHCLISGCVSRNTFAERIIKTVRIIGWSLSTSLRFVKGGILAIFNSISTKRIVKDCKDFQAQLKVPKRTGCISQCVIACYKP